eukprot:scaffold1531_cov247-Chaetoceros_neogracile.AAC.2
MHLPLLPCHSATPTRKGILVVTLIAVARIFMNQPLLLAEYSANVKATLDPVYLKATQSNPVQSKLQHLPNETHLSFCEAHNFLPQVGETVIAQTGNNTRRFSIRKQDFQPTHSVPCGTSNELLQAIAMGQRRWDDDVENANLTLRQKEDYPSTFIPDKCYIPYYEPEQMCDVLNRFSHVIIQGDSLSRHLQGGLLMALRDNVVNGSMVSSNPEMYNCTCDAQFSEHPKCRLNNGLYNRYQPYQLGLCPNLGNDTQQFESVFNINRLHRGVYKFPGVNCTSPESKGVLVIVQGGVHMRFNHASTYHKLIRPFFADPTFRTCAEQGKAIFIWTSYTAQSPDYDDKYPLQKLEVGIKFNNGMDEIFQSDMINASVVNWLNFTIGAQHSDGLHYAAQVNLFKAQHLIALADRLWKEKQFFNLPPAS